MTHFIAEKFTICYRTGYLTGTISTVTHTIGYVIDNTINNLIIIQRNTKTIMFFLVERVVSRHLRLTFILNSYIKLASFPQFMVLFVGFVHIFMFSLILLSRYSHFCELM